MTKEEKVAYTNLCNALTLFAANFEYLKSIDAPDFDIEFELPSEFDIGLTIENINYLETQNIISNTVKHDILELRDYLLEIPDSFWTFDELETNPIWNRARVMANEILDDLGFTDKNYDFSHTKTIYIDDSNSKNS